MVQYREERHDFGTDNLPNFPPPGVMWVFIRDGEAYAVNFLCPCGCGATCYTPLKVSKRDPSWNYASGPNGPTLTPSIHFLAGCKAHFNITDGQAVMHGDSGK